MDEEKYKKWRDDAKLQFMLLQSEMFKDYKEKFQNQSSIFYALIIGVLTGIFINIFTASVLILLPIPVWITAVVSGVILAYLLYRLLMVHLGMKEMAKYMNQISQPKILEAFTDKVIDYYEKKWKDEKNSKDGKG